MAEISEVAFKRAPGAKKRKSSSEQRVFHGPLVRGLGNAEVDYFGNRCAIGLCDENIRRLQVTMDHAFLMRMLDRSADGEE